MEMGNGRNGRCENQPDAVSDSTQDRLSATPTTLQGTINDEIQPNQRQVSEDIRETQSVMAEEGPDDHYQHRSNDTCMNNGLEQLPTCVPMQSPTF